MRKLATLMLVLLAACSPTPTAVPATDPTSANHPATNIATTEPQTVVPTTLIQPTQANASQTSGLWLQILAPLDEAVVSTPQVDVTGSAPAGTVVSINEQILIVDADLQFRTSVILEEGPNLIEIVASDENGHEVSALLTVIYEP